MSAVDGSERGAGARGRASRRTVLVAWCVYLAGAAALMTVAAIFGPGIWPRVSDAGEVIAWVIFCGALLCVPLSSALPRLVKPSPGATAETMVVARSLLAIAFNGAIALMAPLAWMVSGRWAALAALAISLAGLVFAFPSERRWDPPASPRALSSSSSLPWR